MKAQLVKRLTGAIDVPAVGLGVALVALVILVLAFGVAPTALAIGLLALMAAD